MAEYSYLNLEQLSESQANKEVTVNAMLEALAKGTGAISVSVAAGSVTLTEAQSLSGVILLTGAPGAARVVTVDADISRWILFRNDTTGGQLISVKQTGGTSFPVAVGEAVLLLSGTQVVRFAAAAAGGVDVRAYGATGDGVTDDTAAVQAAITAAAGAPVYLPPGTYKITASLTGGDNLCLMGAGPRQTIIKGSLSAALVKSTNTATRYYRWNLRDLTLDNTSRATGGGIGIDLTRISLSLLTNIEILNVETALWLNEEAYYNRLDSVWISTAVTGVKIGSGAVTTNENLFLNLRINDVTNGVIIDNATNTTFVKPAVEVFTGRGFDVAATAATQYVALFSPRLENATAGSSIGIHNRALAQATLTTSPMFASLFTNWTNSASADEFMILSPGVDTPRLRATEVRAASNVDLAGPATSTLALRFLEAGVLRCFLDYNSATTIMHLDADGTMEFAPNNTLALRLQLDGDAEFLADVLLNTAGKGVRIKEGSNARMGTATLVAGTVTVSNTSITANTRIFLTHATLGGTPGVLTTTRSAGASFTITSGSGADTSTVNWLLIEPA